MLTATGVTAAERDIVRTFAVQPGCTVAIDSYRGGILIEPAEAAAGEARIAVHCEIGADSEEEAERVFRGFQLAWSEGANRISVVARHPAESRARFVWNEKNQIEPTFRVTVPRACNLELKTLNGGINVGPVEGRVRAEVENGNIFLRQVTGSAEAVTQFGDIVVSRCVGPLTARVLSGLMRLGPVVGRCELKNSSGDVEVMSVGAGGRIYAEAGSVTLGLPNELAGTLEVTTSFGSIDLTASGSARCDIDASCSRLSRVENKLPLVIDRANSGPRRIVGKLNGGGAMVRLKASGGDVRLRLAESSGE